jgi:hypothetical protein
MSEEYPDYFPPFMRDFHDQKDVVKAFYTWLDMMDAKQEKVNGKKFTELRPRRAQTCPWPSFVVLLASFVDFLNLNGYRIYKARGNGAGNPDEFEEVIKDLKDLPEVWRSLVYPGEMLTYKPEHCIETMDRWANYIQFMPDTVQEAYRKAKAAKVEGEECNA